MKKIICSSIFLALLIVSPAWVSAREGAQAPALAPNLLKAKIPAGDVSFEVSVTPESWSQAKPGKLFTTGFHPADFTLPILRENPVPIRYPRWAVQEGWEGTFVIAVEILKSGKVGRWSVTQSTGYSLLDEAAANAIRQWHFQPGTEKGQAVVTCIQIPVHFELRDSV